MLNPCAPPPDAQWAVGLVFYKIGLRGYLFVHTGIGWRRSTVDSPPDGAVPLLPARDTRTPRVVALPPDLVRGARCKHCRSTVRYAGNGQCTFCCSGAGRAARRSEGADLVAVREAWEVERGFV